MLKTKTKWLQVMIITTLVLLAIQFEIGMAVNLSTLPSLSPLGFSVPNLFSALRQAGNAAIVHATLGTVLTLVALIGMVLSINSMIRKVQVFGILGFLAMAMAEFNGVSFTMSGFQNDNYSHGMATGFILTFGFYFLELYFLRPNQVSNPRLSQ